MRSTSSKLRVALLAAAWAAVGAAAGGASDTLDPRESYSYLRTVEGTVTISSVGTGPASESADVNQPLLTGDRLRLPRGSRAEAVLADRNVLRLGGGASVTLTRIAFSGDRDERLTTLDLEEGEILLQVGEDALGDQLPEVRTQGAAIYVQQPGTYRVTADRGGWTEVVVRDGYAEVVSDRGSTVVRAGEIATVLADRFGRVELGAAPTADALERWGVDLYQRAEVARTTVVHVDPYLAYSAAPLASHGDWVYIDASWAWRPRVAAGWRPYWNGRWCPTPSGLTWVAYEPWGWVPYHYGTWFVDASYGWCWRPGRVYSPAWVYWHWSDRWVGWCPVGYYTNYYSRFGFHGGFRFGVYGWAGGGWNAYADWHFVPSWCLRQRDWRHHQRSGHDLARIERDGPSRGIVTTDTRGITRKGLERPHEIVESLARRRGEGPESLVDVTDFVARKRELPPRVADAVGARGEPVQPGAPLALPGGKGRRGDVEPGWRSGQRTDNLSREPAAVGTGKGAFVPVEPQAPRLTREPAKLDTSQRVQPGSGSTGRGDAPKDPEIDSPRTRNEPARVVDPRQGWKSGVPATVATPPSARGRDAPREEPVQRVIGGLRRPEPATTDRGTALDRGAATSQPSGGDRRTMVGDGARDRSGSPRATTPSWGAPSARPPASGSPRASTPSSPRVTSPSAPPGARTVGVPPTATSPRTTPPSVAASPPRSGSSQKSSPPPKASSGSSRPGSKSSPPPRSGSSSNGGSSKGSGGSGGSSSKGAKGGDGNR